MDKAKVDELNELVLESFTSLLKSGKPLGGTTLKVIVDYLKLNGVSQEECNSQEENTASKESDPMLDLPFPHSE